MSIHGNLPEPRKGLGSPKDNCVRTADAIEISS